MKVQVSLRKKGKMNKIILENDEVVAQLDESVVYELSYSDLLGVNLLKIEVFNDTSMDLVYNFGSDVKLEVQIHVNSGVHLNLYEKVVGDKAKVRTKYYLLDDSDVVVSKFDDVRVVNEYVVIMLLGMRAKIKYNLKTVALDVLNYDILTYHNASDTVSNIINNGVCIKDGRIKFNVSSFVPSGSKNCDVSQSNKIVNLTDNECVIKPNLYIDEFDVSASHSAWIGSVNEDSLFYLMSRGIDRDSATRLLVKGFLTGSLDIDDDKKNDIIRRIDDYWR